MVICTYPGLFAAYHVLHRLPEPRHPPFALICFFYFFIRIWTRKINHESSTSFCSFVLIYNLNCKSFVYLFYSYVWTVANLRFSTVGLQHTLRCGFWTVSSSESYRKSIVFTYVIFSFFSICQRSFSHLQPSWFLHPHFSMKIKNLFFRCTWKMSISNGSMSDNPLVISFSHLFLFYSLLEYLPPPA